MVQQFRSVAVPAEDKDSVPSTHRAVCKAVSLVPGELALFWLPQVPGMHECLFIYAGKTHTHTVRIDKYAQRNKKITFEEAKEGLKQRTTNGKYPKGDSGSNPP